MKSWLLILVLIISNSLVYSQFDPQFSQYMMSHSLFNPAAVGENDMVNIVTQQRVQWLGMPNAGRTSLYSLDLPFQIGNSKNGVGINVMTDKIGQFNNQKISFKYAYKKDINNGFLSFGIEFGNINVGFNGDSIRKIPIGDYHQFENDPAIPKKNVNGNAFDFGLGFFYKNDKFRAGVSYSHLNSPTIIWDDYSKFLLQGNICFSSGIDLIVEDTKYIVKPSTFIMSDIKSLQIDLTTLVEYDKKYWGGLTYRFGNTFVVIIGLNLKSGFALGYSYDLPTSKIIYGSSGSHEIYLNYKLNLIRSKNKLNIKSVKIL